MLILADPKTLFTLARTAATIGLIVSEAMA
jgi:hypothetical protein